MPGRKYSSSNSYRYGFNAKENDNEIKGEGNQQDYGLRIYDPRLGKFLSVDPLITKYSELTPYQFASNTPIESVDLDGAERMRYITQFKYNGTISSNPIENVPNAIANGVIKVLNIVPDLWNSAVSNVESVKRGTWGKDMASELKGMYNGLGNYVYNSVNYTFNTPIKQQFVDFGKTLDNPETLENGVAAAVGSKLFTGVSNLMKVETAAGIMGIRRNLAASFYKSLVFLLPQLLVILRLSILIKQFKQLHLKKEL